MQPEARAQLRQARQAAGLSLRELGVRIGVSASLLSQIERGNSEPSVASLYALVKELGVSLDALAGTSGGAAGRPQGAVAAFAHTSPVIRPPQRAHLDMTSGVHWEQLSHPGDPVAQALLVSYAPGSSSSSDATLMTHSGVEFAYLMEGELTLTLGFERIVLSAGDSLRFESSQPHMYHNESQQIARGLWFVVGRTATGIAGGGTAPLARRAVERTGADTSYSSAVDVLRVFGHVEPSGSDSGVA